MKKELSKRNILEGINWRSSIMIFVLILVAIIFSILTKGIFLTSRNLTLLLRQTCILGVVSLGMVTIIITRNFDISIGSVVGLNATILAILILKFQWNIWLVIFTVILIGIVIGAWNGFLTAYVGVPSFVVTLGGMMLFRGAQLLVSNGATISISAETFKKIANDFFSPKVSLIIIIILFIISLVSILVGRNSQKKYELRPSLSKTVIQIIVILIIFGFLFYITFTYKGIPYPVAILAIIAVALNFILNKTRFGRRIYATGGNPNAATLSGIRTKRIVFQAFLLMGAMSGIGGIMLASRLGAATPDAGFGLEMDAIAAAVIGGASLFGGVGTIFGTIIGALVLSSVDNGMSLLNISSSIQYVIKGLILIGAVSFDVRMRNK